ncbi:MAG: ferritin family protein [Anaerolineales bacterium]|jgi:rubrerythrin
MDIRKVYHYALEREREGKRFYQQNAGRLSHAAAVEAFTILAGEEQKHIDFIKEKISELEGGHTSQGDFQKAAPDENFFSSRAGTESLDQTVAEAMVPDLPVLRMAYLIERDFAEYYESAAQKAEGEAAEVLKSLASWERRHEAFFRELYDAAYEVYAQMPWGG